MDKLSRQYVLELVIRPNQITAFDSYYRENCDNFTPIQTKVRIRDGKDMAWILRGVENNAWGLVGKSRFYVVTPPIGHTPNLIEGHFCFPLFKKQSTLTGSVWTVNPELTRIVQPS